MFQPRRRNHQTPDCYVVNPFKATAFHTGKFVPLTEANLKGGWPVFVFYPADFTVMRLAELADLADHYAEFQTPGVEICGVSTDTPFTHNAWHGNSDTLAKEGHPPVGDPTRISCCPKRRAALRAGRLQQRVSERRQVFFK